MQLAPVPAITSGMLIATAADPVSGAPVDVITGRVLRTGVRDVRETGWELIRSTHDPLTKEAWGTVAFLRAGDTWTAVELLMKTSAKTEPLWLLTHVTDARITDDVKIDAVWQVSHYGGDYTSRAQKHGWIAPPA